MRIKRAGCLVAVEGLPPAIQAELSKQLTYKRYGMVADGFGGVKGSAEERQLWTMQDDGSFVTSCGFVPRIYRVAEQMGHSVDAYVRLDRAGRELTPDLAKVDAPGLREGQKEMLTKFATYEGGLIVSPTGTGKSYGIRELCAMYSDAKILIVAPGIDAVGTLTRYLAPKLRGDVGELFGGKRTARRVTVSTFESMLKVDSPDNIDIFIVDEVHHAPAETYAEYCGAITSPFKRFGFTATHGGRSDNADLVNEGLFGPVVMEVPYYLAVARGEIVPLHIIVHEHHKMPPYDTTKKIRQNARKDRLALWRNGLRNRMMARDIESILSGDPNAQFLVICSKVEHQAFLVRELNSLGLDFSHVSGDLDKKRIDQLRKAGAPIDWSWQMKKRKRTWMRKQFEKGELRRVVATEVWAKAMSANDCEYIYYASGSGAVNTAIQAAGRTSRTAEDMEGKVGTVIIPRDMNNKTYRARCDKLIRAFVKDGHKITRVKDD